MKKKLTLLLLSFLMAAFTLKAEDLTKDFKTGTPEIKSMTQLSFGPEGILFIGDAKSAKIIAVSMDKEASSASTVDFKGIKDVEGKIAAMLGAKADEIIIHDMAVNPLSKKIYLAVSRATVEANADSYWKLPSDLSDANVLIEIGLDAKMKAVPLENVKYAEIEIPNPVKEDAEYWRGNARTDAISDIAYENGKLYIAGLSNEEFASTLRVIPFPFVEDKVSSSTIEIYHAAHGKFETEAPIRAFLPYQLKGESYLLASYTCTPLVTIPTASLQNAKHVKGRTVAELGMWNMPLDMITYKKEGKEYILIANSTRNLMRIDPADIEKFEGTLTKKVDRFNTEGVKYTTIPLAVRHMDKLDDEHVLLLSRMPYGTMQLSNVSTKAI